MEGILLVDKPDGWTSFDVVAYVRKMVARIEGKKPRNVKVGHTGTLDPAATGLLVLCIGKAYTSQIQTMIKHDKTYEVELTLGKNSSTGDREGDFTDVSSTRPDENVVVDVCRKIIGEQEQIPPAYSAVKVNGVRAYKLAREGKEVKLQPKQITVHSVKNIIYAYPRVQFTASVSSGTYIRVLAEKIGENLGTGAYMSALRRTTVGEYKISQAYEVSALTPELMQKVLVTNR